MDTHHIHRTAFSLTAADLFVSCLEVFPVGKSITSSLITSFFSQERSTVIENVFESTCEWLTDYGYIRLIPTQGYGLTEKSIAATDELLAVKRAWENLMAAYNNGSDSKNSDIDVNDNSPLLNYIDEVADAIFVLIRHSYKNSIMVEVSNAS